MSAPRFLPINMLTAMYPTRRQQPSIETAEVRARKAAWKARLSAKDAKRDAGHQSARPQTSKDQK